MRILSNKKRKWFVNTSKTILLIVIIILCYIGINVGIKKLDVNDIDVTEKKIYTLSNESIEKTKNISKNVNIYFFGYEEDNAIVDLAKKYGKTNEKIKTEVIKLEERPDLVTKYGVTKDDVAIVVESDNGEKILTTNDLYTYDYTTYEQIDVSEQKLTNAILLVTTETKPSIYFLTGHNEYSLKSHMNLLNAYLTNDVNEVKELNILVSNQIPEDCKVLIIASNQTDFSDYETELITNYINKGGNIIWLNDPKFKDESLPNTQKILDLYGVSFDNKGIILEQDAEKIIMQTPAYILPDISYTSFTSQISTDGGVALLDTGRIKIKSDTELTELNVEYQPILTSSEKSFYRSNLSNSSSAKSDGDEEGSQVLGAMLTKKISDNQKSTLIMYANNIFITDYSITIGNQKLPAISLFNNKDLMLNSVAYLTNTNDAITIRKETGTVTYTATKQQDLIIKIVIFTFPILIIIAGIIVWQIRRRHK